ncbi:hypothetical protein Vadar_030754 [Vaccinium darrowii]|nr:hypothetical protein Vadar_030754 [Vaccinium darrowii]
MGEEIVERLRSFSLTPEEEDDIVIDAAVRERAIVDCSTSLVGKLLTKRAFSRAALKDTMRKVWGSPEGLRMVDVGDNLFHFRFSNEMDLQRVFNGGPWCFDNMVLLLKRWEAGLRADSVEFKEIDFWIQLWGLPFEYITQEIGGEIGRRIGTVLEVNKVSEKGEWGRYVRVRVRIPLNRPLRRGGNIVLGEGSKCWVDYKYERLPILCHYCGMLDHEIRECPSKSKDVLEGCVKKVSYGSWMAATPSFWRGYKWKDNQGSQRRWGGEGGAAGGKDTGMAAGSVRRGEQLRDGNGKDMDEMVSRDSSLIEVADNTVVAINGNEFRMGDLIPDFARNLNVTETCGGLVSRPSLEVGNRGAKWANGRLGYKANEAQVSNNDVLDLGKGSGGLGCSEIGGPLVSSGPAQTLDNMEGGRAINQNTFLDARASSASKVPQLEKSVRVLPDSFRGKTRGRKHTSAGKRKAPGVGVSRDRRYSSQNVGKRRLDALEGDGLAEQAGKRTFLGDITNASRVEVADPNRPPTPQ